MGNKQTIFTEEQLDNYQSLSGAPATSYLAFYSRSSYPAFYSHPRQDPNPSPAIHSSAYPDPERDSVN
ncbi:hypothetical protein P7K49_017373 [Saguinus oedipus]|uniref:Uncharacterized protein n=1 Tax=Saguinus oedipus TaxID=9490 RepID=A0ABQ9V2B6_SAGOE|nr:hypothetical protein P7K49_017373 [Saguinus oedipus]